MQKIISMVEFVLEQLLLLKNGEINILQFRNRIERYANFLKQPLTLGMFVPCDIDGNVLDEPPIFKEWIKLKDTYPYSEYANIKCEEYQEAKERVIFENFIFKKETENSYWIIEEGSFSYFIEKGLNQDIECVIHKGFRLTESAKKQILGS